MEASIFMASIVATVWPAWTRGLPVRLEGVEAVVDRIITDLAVVDVTSEGLRGGDARGRRGRSVTRYASLRRPSWAPWPSRRGPLGMGAVFDTAGRSAWALSLTGSRPGFRSDRRASLGKILLDEVHRLTGHLARS